MVSKIIKKTWFPRIFPFILFVSFIALESLIEKLAKYYPLLANFSNYSGYIFYPIKTVIVAIILILFWKRYTEINMKQGVSWKSMFIGLLTGIVVFILWINMDWGFATLGEPKGFNPNMFESCAWTTVIVAFRLFGSSVVVPVFEELFWRSFVMRYIINSKFEDVPLGKFTWVSFIIASALFGFEHNLWLAGIMAGMLYSMLLYYTKNLSVVIFSHGVTNLLLGIYVITTGNWQFW